MIDRKNVHGNVYRALVRHVAKLRLPNPIAFPADDGWKDLVPQLQPPVFRMKLADGRTGGACRVNPHQPAAGPVDIDRPVIEPDHVDEIVRLLHQRNELLALLLPLLNLGQHFVERIHQHGHFVASPRGGCAHRKALIARHDASDLSQLDQGDA